MDRKVIMLSARDLQNVYTFTAVVYLAVLVRCYFLMSGEWPNAARITFYCIASIPAFALQLATKVLQYIYGYAEGIGGGARWRALDVTAVVACVIALACCGAFIALFYDGGFATIANTRNTIHIVAFFIATVILATNVLRRAWRDYNGWQTSIYCGNYNESFKDYVAACFETIEAV